MLAEPASAVKFEKGGFEEPETGSAGAVGWIMVPEEIYVCTLAAGIPSNKPSGLLDSTLGVPSPSGGQHNRSWERCA